MNAATAPQPDTRAAVGAAMSLEGLSRPLVWALLLRRVAGGGAVLHGGRYVTDHGFPVPSHAHTVARELLDCGLVRVGFHDVGWDQRRLHLTRLGQDVLIDLVARHPEMHLDSPTVIAARLIAGLRSLPGPT